MCVLQKDSSRLNPEPTSTDAEGWERRERMTKNDADLLLDWLEANGYSQKEVVIAEDGCFTVRWRRSEPRP